MIRTLFAALAFVAMLSLLYCIGAFIAWEANPGNWAEDGRRFAAIFGVPLAAMASFHIFTSWDDI